MLFSLVISNLFRLLNYTRLEENIYICLHGVDQPCFLFELRTFIIEPLLLFKKSLLFRLQCLQTRQFFIVLHGKQRTPCRLEDHKFGFMLCLEPRLVFSMDNILAVPIHLKMALTTKEATEYSNIGINKIDSMLRSPNCPFVLFVGTKKLVKRKEFEQFISEKLVI